MDLLLLCGALVLVCLLILVCFFSFFSRYSFHLAYQIGLWQCKTAQCDLFTSEGKKTSTDDVNTVTRVCWCLCADHIFPWRWANWAGKNRQEIECYFSLARTHNTVALWQCPIRHIANCDDPCDTIISVAMWLCQATCGQAASLLRSVVYVRLRIRLFFFISILLRSLFLRQKEMVAIDRAAHQLYTW